MTWLHCKSYQRSKYTGCIAPYCGMTHLCYDDLFYVMQDSPLLSPPTAAGKLGKAAVHQRRGGRRNSIITITNNNNLPTAVILTLNFLNALFLNVLKNVCNRRRFMVGACALQVKNCNILYPTRQAGNIIRTHILAVFVKQKQGFDPFHSIIVASSHTTVVQTCRPSWLTITKFWLLDFDNKLSGF